MAGYKGFSMSNNAVSAYEDGERPISKWSKASILNNVSKEYPNVDFELIKKLTLEDLRLFFLKRTSWHHTSSKYNRTDFYSFDDSLEESDIEIKIKNYIEYAKNNPVKKEVIENNYITALVSYTVWVGNFKNYRKPVERFEIVKYRTLDKMVQTLEGNKRLSSLSVIDTIIQKTGYAKSAKAEWQKRLQG